jgi:hypothetical protein
MGFAEAAGFNGYRRSERGLSRVEGLAVYGPVASQTFNKAGET